MLECWTVVFEAMRSAAVPGPVVIGVIASDAVMARELAAEEYRRALGEHFAAAGRRIVLVDRGSAMLLTSCVLEAR